MSVKFSNNGHSTLASSLSSSATSITVASGHGARFPSLTGSEYFYATLIDSSNNLEIVKVTARSSDVLTVTRAQESTTARAYAIGDRVELRVTAQGLVDVGTPAADSIVNSMIADDAVDTPQIADDAINAALIDDNAVGAAALNVSGNGSSGQVLISDGDGTFSWSAVSSDFVKLVTYDISSAVSSFNVTGWIDSAYKFYVIRAYIEFSGNDYPTLRFINSSGSAISSSDYDWSAMHPYVSSGSANSNTHGAANSSGFRPHSTNSFSSYHGQHEIILTHENLVTAQQTSFIMRAIHRESGGQVDNFTGGGFLKTNDTITGSSAGIQYDRSNSANFSDGHVIIYGMK
jgi:ribosomal protein L18